VPCDCLGSGPGIDRIGHQEQKRGSPLSFFCGFYPRLDRSWRVDERQATHHPMPPDFWLRFPSPFSLSSMPARHRHRRSSERRKSITITLESCSRSVGIRVHDALETVNTMSRHAPQLMTADMRSYRSCAAELMIPERIEKNDVLLRIIRARSEGREKRQELVFRLKSPGVRAERF
jgi:hypothetical protein